MRAPHPDELRGRGQESDIGGVDQPEDDADDDRRDDHGHDQHDAHRADERQLAQAQEREPETETLNSGVFVSREEPPTRAMPRSGSGRVGRVAIVAGALALLVGIGVAVAIAAGGSGGESKTGRPRPRSGSRHVHHRRALPVPSKPKRAILPASHA